MSTAIRTRDEIIAGLFETNPEWPAEVREQFADFQVEQETTVQIIGEPPACPSWCVDKPGHTFDSSGPKDASRSHVSTMAGDVGIAQAETVSRDGTVDLEAAMIQIYGKHEDLSGTEARALIAGLTKAADLYDAFAAAQQ